MCIISTIALHFNIGLESFSEFEKKEYELTCVNIGKNRLTV